MTLSPTKKLFHVVVVVGMGATVAGCSSTGDPQDASGDVHNDALSTNDSSATDGSIKDVSIPDVATNADACAGWAPCC